VVGLREARGGRYCSIPPRRRTLGLEDMVVGRGDCGERKMGGGWDGKAAAGAIDCGSATSEGRKRRLYIAAIRILGAEFSPKVSKIDVHFAPSRCV
jgi:hypothetical protein